MATAARIRAFQLLSSRTLELLCEEASAHLPTPLGVCRKNLVARRVLPLRDPASWSWRGDYWNDSGSL
ncbi:protein of unknown function [Cyanobium sp. NIES-981]|nr:protein of unknown function [Cyanobium sp. NIES-981]